jgi:antitoxin MazE
MRASLRKMGNSSGVVIPKPLLRELGVGAGDPLDVAVNDGKIVITPIRPHPRAGWAEDAKRLAEAGEELAWPVFGNDDDEKLVW